MSKGDRGAIFAVGLVAGIAVALFFFVWAFPWFTDPSQSAGYCQPNDSQCAEQYQNPDDPHFWIRPFHGWLFAEDSLAQWLMAAFGVLATGVSFWAVILVRDTLELNRRATKAAEDAVAVTREMGMAQTRAYLSVTGGTIRYGALGPDIIPSVEIIVKNTGQSPAFDVWIHCVTYIQGRQIGFSPFNRGQKINLTHSSVSRTIGAGLEHVHMMDLFADRFRGVPGTYSFRIDGIVSYRTVFDSPGKELDPDDAERNEVVFDLSFVEQGDKVKVATSRDDIVTYPMSVVAGTTPLWLDQHRSHRRAIHEREKQKHAKEAAEQSR